MNSSSHQESEAPRQRFIMDYSMNKVAKYFRLLGYDTICDRVVLQRDILRIATEERRRLITSSRCLQEQVEAHNRHIRKLTACSAGTRRHVVAYDSDGESIYSDNSDGCLGEISVVFIDQWRRKDFNAAMVKVIRAASLSYDISLVFSRCVTCNEVPVDVRKVTVEARVDPKIYAMYEGFAECPKCRRVFWGFDGEKVSNYKSFRTLGLLRSLCQAAGTPIRDETLSLSSLSAFRSFPRVVKATVFSYLEAEDLGSMALVFPILGNLLAEVLECRRLGSPVKEFREIKRQNARRCLNDTK